MKIKIPEIVGFLMLISILFGIGYLFPYSYVLGKASLTEPDIAEQLNLYSDIILFGFAMIIIYVINFIWKKNDKYGDNIGIYNKEETMFKNFTYPQISLLSIIFFMTLFLILRFFDILQKGFFGLKILPQQFSPIDSLLVSTAQIPVAENFMAGFTIGLISLLITFLAIKYSIKKEEFIIYKYIAVILGLSIFGYVWHQNAYSGSDIASIVVAVFWGLGSLLSLVTGFFVPFLVMHMTNNFFIDFGRLYTSDIVLATIISILVIFSVIYYFIYKGRLFPIKE